MSSRVAGRRFLKVDATLVDALVGIAHRFQDESHLVAGGPQVSATVEHRRIGPVLSILHVLASSVHTTFLGKIKYLKFSPEILKN